MSPFIWQTIVALLIGRQRVWLKTKRLDYWLNFLEFSVLYQNDVICNTSPFSVLLVQISKEHDRIWGSYGQKTTQKQSQIQLSAATKTFESL